MTCFLKVGDHFPISQYFDDGNYNPTLINFLIMAINPLYNTNDSPSNSTQPTKSVNRQGVYVPRNSQYAFDNSYFHSRLRNLVSMSLSLSWKEYQEIWFLCTLATTSAHSPMASPFLSSLKLNKDYFMCPMPAILPNTWEYIFRQPVQGDDVPDDANCLFPAILLDTWLQFCWLCY